MAYQRSDILTNEEIFQRCRFINEHVDKEIGDFTASLLGSSNSTPTPHDNNEAMRRFLDEKIKKSMQEKIGKEKCEALFNHIEGLKTTKDKFDLGIAVYKLSIDNPPLNSIKNMSKGDFQSLLEIIDQMIKNEPVSLEEQYRNIDQHESVYRQEKSSMIELAAEKIKASVGESDGVMGAAKGGLKFLKDKISPGKTEKNSDKTMMDLLSSPVNAVLICFALCLVGSGGWVPFVLSTQLAMSGFSFLRGNVSESTQPGIYNPLGTSGNRLPPKLFTGTAERQESGESYQSSKKTFTDREQERKFQQNNEEHKGGGSGGLGL
ncbi:MAG: hypothetical protein ACTJLL_04365 [Anaplasma sp.]